MGHPNLEVFLIQIRHELLRNTGKSLTNSNLTKEEWEARRSGKQGGVESKEEWEARRTFTDDRSMMNYFSGIVDRLISSRDHC